MPVFEHNSALEIELINSHVVLSHPQNFTL